MSRVAVLTHGAGSSPDAARRLLAPALPVGATVVCVEVRRGIDDAVARIGRAVLGHDVVLAAGISLGAHATARWAAQCGTAAALALVMPAWTGSTGPVAALTLATAQDVAARGREPVLRELVEDDATRADWVVEELVRAWATYPDEELARALVAAATSRGPKVAELASIRGPVAVVALADDPFHPEAVARSWAGSIPRAALAVVPRHAPAADRGALGRAARDVLDGLSESR